MIITEKKFEGMVDNLVGYVDNNIEGLTQKQTLQVAEMILLEKYDCPFTPLYVSVSKKSTRKKEDIPYLKYIEEYFKRRTQ